MEYVKLGLGEDVESVDVRPDAGGGNVSLWLRFIGKEARIAPSAISDGQLAWLAFVALYRLPSKGGLLIFDEPELHLNPRLLARAADLLEATSSERTVIVATHSDRFLDVLKEPAAAVVACELDAQRRTVLKRPDPEALADWLEDYAGFGAIRAAGHEGSVLEEAVE